MNHFIFISEFAVYTFLSYKLRTMAWLDTVFDWHASVQAGPSSATSLPRHLTHTQKPSLYSIQRDQKSVEQSNRYSQINYSSNSERKRDCWVKTLCEVSEAFLKHVTE